MAKRKTKLEEWGESELDLRSMSNEALRETLRATLTGTSRRIASLKKNKSFSYAMFRYEQEMQKTFINGVDGIKNLLNVDVNTDMREGYRKLLQQAVKTTHNFWASKTATKAGARKEQMEQSARIFGVDNRGRPNHVMTFEESKKYWSLYDEYYNMFPDRSRRDSDRVQRYLGEVFAQTPYSLVKNPKRRKNFDFVQVLADVRERLMQDELMQEMRDRIEHLNEPSFRLKVGADDDDIDI